MKRRLLYLFMLCFAGISFAQQQLENAGFENWEDDTGPYIEPTQWSSIKTSDVPNLNSWAPQVVDRSTDAHSGSYSLYLENVSSVVVANGIVTNGQVHADVDPKKGYVFTNASNSKWNTAFNSRPDSIVGWYKYSPSGADHGKVEVALHTGTNAQLPENGTAGSFVGQARFDMPNSDVTSWTRFTAPFHYTSSSDPEYILVVITSGDSTNAVAGSTALIDDVELIYNPLSVEETEIIEFSVSGFENGLKVWGTSVLENSVKIQLVDLQGREVANRYWNPSSDLVWNLGELNGVYLIRFYLKDKIVTQKVFIE